MASCSKAPRGLFVLLRGGRIFTATSISPRPPSRQRPDRDTFRAGRNLPDKEFRYLRTVIVTAAVYRGFGSALARLPLTFRHWAGVSPHTSARAFAETCVCVKQSPGPGHCGPLELGAHGPPPYAGHPFSRSYGVNLPSSLTEVPSPTWGSSPCPPVSVCGTVARVLASAFSRSPRPTPLGRGRAPASLSPLAHRRRAFPPADSLPAWTPATGAGVAARGPRLADIGRARGGNHDPLAIAYGSRPRLRAASPAADEPCCGTLGHPVEGFLAPLALLIPAFALPAAPPPITRRLRRRRGRSPTESTTEWSLPWLRCQT